MSIESCYSVRMHPYLSEQLGAAHRQELLRVAASRNYRTDDRVLWAGARRRTGVFLVRAGHRLGRLDAFDAFGAGLSAGPPRSAY